MTHFPVGFLFWSVVGDFLLPVYFLVVTTRPVDLFSVCQFDETPLDIERAETGQRWKICLGHYSREITDKVCNVLMPCSPKHKGE